MGINLTKSLLEDIIGEINGDSEKSRRALSLRRHKIFRDGGKEFLIEELQREFGRQNLAEFRLCPLNYLKLIIDKKSQIYKQPPRRMASTGLESDQRLIDFWTDELALNDLMAKANRYFNLHANTALYAFPFVDSLRLAIVPPHLYSIVPNQVDQTKVEVWLFNNFIEESDVISDQGLPVPERGGPEGFSRDRRTSAPDLVASQELISGQKRRFIIWTDNQHMTVTNDGDIVVLDPEKGEEQFMNPIGISPIVHLQKDVDNEPWAEQGEDAADIALLLQKAWTDLMTIIKHQGFGQMVITSAEQPQRTNIGINKVIWLKQLEGKEPPTLQFVTADSRISEIKETIRDLTFMLLTTNSINPSAVGRADGGATFESGIQALLEMSDALEAMKMDQPILRDAEKELWQVISKWHNWMHDNGILKDEARVLGKFSDGFDLNIAYGELKPMETEKERLDLVERGRSLRLLTKKDMLKRLNPDLTDSEIDAKLAELEEERNANMQLFSVPNLSNDTNNNTPPMGGSMGEG